MRQTSRLLLTTGTLFTAMVPAAAAPTIVTIENFTFKPAELAVKPGTMVTFKNADDIPHSVVAADGSFHSRALDTGDEVTRSMSKPGDFVYFCGLHPHMKGRITVVP